MSDAATYNAAEDLIGRNLAARPDKTAVIDPDGAYSYAEVAQRVEWAGAALLSVGLKPHDRIVVCLLDGIDFVAVFLGAIRVGVVPIALNTLLSADDYAYILGDSGARGAVVAAPLLPQFAEAIRLGGWSGELIVSGQAAPDPGRSLAALMAQDGPAPIHWADPQDIAFWLYSSGSTGRPKGTPHRHASPVKVAELFGRDTFGLREDDVVYSAAKLFFAYGIGNSLFFPMTAGATTVLFPGRVTPEVIARLIAEHAVTVFCGVPTLFGAILASEHIPAPATGLRLCMSAGEALPEEIGRAWTEHTGTEIVDGIGSTEMLHIYVSNRPGDVRYGTTGQAVPGYDVKLLDEHRDPVGPGGIGELYVRGPTMTPFYWNSPDKSAATFIDGWMKTGDKFRLHEDGRLSYCGRSDDMLKVSGIWVSPSEVENALLAHEAVLESAVIGVTDEAGLVKTKAFVVVKPGVRADETLAQALKDFIKGRLAVYKYPRAIAFVDRLPRTATGKIRRHVLREREATVRSATEKAPS
jgi:benzoate-CoA ligase